MNPLIQPKKAIPLFLVALTCFGFSPMAHAFNRFAQIIKVIFFLCTILFSLRALGGDSATLNIDPNESADGDGSRQHPFVARRDNPAVGGELKVTDATVEAQVSSKFLSDGVWKNLLGHFKFREYREHGWRYADQFTPIMPRDNFHGPGTAKYATRAGLMVRRNVYGLSMAGNTVGGDNYVLEDAKLIKLSDDVLVVPVVVVLWHNTESLKDPHFDLTQFWTARNMFDFQPLHMTKPAYPYQPDDDIIVWPLPLASIQVLFANEIDSPSPYWLAAMPPNRWETPPDELWAECGIQFQVVGQFIVPYPRGWLNHCYTQELNFGNPEPAIADQLAWNPDLRDYLLNDLKPVFVSYGDLSLCENVFSGSTPPYLIRFIEIDWHHSTVTTAHELGHVLDLPHEKDSDGNPVDGNLMRTGAGAKDTDLTEEQCQKARIRAKAFSQGYDYYNWVTGRTYSDVPAPPPTRREPPPRRDDDRPIRPPGEQVCCLGERDVEFKAPRDCSDVVRPEQCEIVCCSNGLRETRYLCEKQGGIARPCPPPG
jgi:hypothetical protein